VSERLPRLTALEIIRILERRGFSLSRSSGSHQIFKNSAGRRVTVPVHAGKTLHPKVLQSILRDMDMTEIELKSELKRRGK
jgi:predicted RNA binding protein YcfA (HicA-like mRNA interferase family)